MMIRAIACCAALILGLLATLGATAQSASACNNAACRSAGRAAPLDLMAFMRGGKSSGKSATRTASAKANKPRHGASRSAARIDNAPVPVAQPEPAALPAAAAYASHTDSDVQVVTSDELNTIDLAMARSAPETIGASPKTDGLDSDVSVRVADVRQPRDAAKSSNDAALPSLPAGKPDAPRDESWTGRLWSALGDGFVALFAMLRQLFS
jgi:hypothetical protein